MTPEKFAALVRSKYTHKPFTLEDCKHLESLETLDKKTAEELLESIPFLMGWYGCPNKELYKFQEALKPTVLPSIKKAKVYRGVKCNPGNPWGSLMLNVKEGDIVELPMKSEINACSCTTYKTVATNFAGKSFNKGWVLKLVDKEAALFVAPPKHSAMWFNRLLEAYPGGVSSYRGVEHEVIAAPPKDRNTLRFECILKVD